MGPGWSGLLRREAGVVPHGLGDARWAVTEPFRLRGERPGPHRPGVTPWGRRCGSCPRAARGAIFPWRDLPRGSARGRAVVRRGGRARHEGGGFARGGERAGTAWAGRGARSGYISSPSCQRSSRVVRSPPSLPRTAIPRRSGPGRPRRSVGPPARLPPPVRPAGRAPRRRARRAPDAGLPVRPAAPSGTRRPRRRPSCARGTGPAPGPHAMSAADARPPGDGRRSTAPRCGWAWRCWWAR